MFSLQEISQNEKIKLNLKETEQYMDRFGFFDPKECNVFAGLKRSERHELAETLKHLTLKEWMTSTTRSTGFAGAGGINYLVPTWISNQLAVCCDPTDIGPKVAGMFIPDQSGDAVNFNAIVKSYTPRNVAGEGSGGITVGSGTAYTQRWASNIGITNEMMEDQQYALMDLAVKACGQNMIQQSNDQILSVFARATGSLGSGSKQTASAGADTTTPAQLATICAQVASSAVGNGMYKPDLLLVTPEVWWDALTVTAGHPEVHPSPNGYDAWYGALNTVIVQTQSANMGLLASNRLTNAVTIVAAKAAALGVARKNWMRIENYSDPIRDLAGAVLTGKQAAAELVNGAIGVLTET
jgi:hypothetical protein